MGRPKAQRLWDTVTKLEDGRWQCKFCEHKYRASASRIKAHLFQVKGRGVSICPDAPNNFMNTESLSDRADNNMLEVRDSGSKSEGLLHHDSKERDSSSVSKNSSEEQNVGEELESQVAKKRKTKISKQYGKELTNSEMVPNIDELLDDSDLVDKQLEFTSQQITKQAGGELINPDQILLIDRMFGPNFNCYVENIWQILCDENVFVIGLVGMGGVGKTLLARHIFDKIQKGTSSFDGIFWVTVSQNFKIYKLQNDIAQRVGLDVGNEDDERMRAGRLSLAWESIGKSVLILDDVWERIDLQKVGITPKVNGNKLILTSRSLNVCLQMNCAPNSIIKVEPLSEEASWDLFMQKLGSTEGLSSAVVSIATNVVSELQGLPLAIEAMATCMKGVMSVHTWRHVLSKLRNSVFLEEMDTVFRVLRSSYDNLNEQMKKCLLFCALYPEDFAIERQELIMKFTDEGLIDLRKSLEEILDEGHFILNKLVDNYLLVDCGRRHWSGRRCVKMHKSIRDMASLILTESHRSMVKAGRGLTRIPHVEQWTASLVKVSLMRNNIKEISPNTSPCCPQLSTLILSDNPLKRTPDCFFIHMHALSSLDLSYTDIKILPKSVSDLKSLVSLVLKGCSKLVSLPTLGQLQTLSKLDLSFTAIHNIPQGLERLVNLKWIDLSENTKLELVGGSVLSNLTSLQFLKLNLNFVKSVQVKAEDLKKMSCLQYFEGSLYDHEHFNEFVSILNHGRELYYYILHLGTGHLKFDFSGYSRSVAFGDCEDNVHRLPISVEAMRISENYHWHSLCDVLSFEGSSSLKLCIIDHCPRLETLFCRSASCSFCNSLPLLETLRLIHLNRLPVIWKEIKDVAGCTFTNLTNIYVSRCDQLEVLLTASMVAHLHNLVKIHVCDSRQFKEIFSVASTEEEEEECSNNAEGIDNECSWDNLTLHKLQELVLSGLPQLKSVCKGVLDCRSFRKFTIVNCPNLRSFPSIRSCYDVQVINDVD